MQPCPAPFFLNTYFCDLPMIFQVGKMYAFYYNILSQKDRTNNCVCIDGAADCLDCCCYEQGHREYRHPHVHTRSSCIFQFLLGVIWLLSMVSMLILLPPAVYTESSYPHTLTRKTAKVNFFWILWHGIIISFNLKAFSCYRGMTTHLFSFIAIWISFSEVFVCVSLLLRVISVFILI